MSMQCNAISLCTNFLRLIDKTTRGSIDGFNMDIFVFEGRNYLRLCAANKCMLGTRPIRIKEWTHVAVSFDSTVVNGVTLYVNGHVDAIYNSYDSPTGNAICNIVIGSTSKPYGHEVLNGTVDEISIWNRTLTHTEVRKLLFQRLAGDEIGLLLYYPIDDDDKIEKIRNHALGKYHGYMEGIVEFVAVAKKPLYVTEFD